MFYLDVALPVPLRKTFFYLPQDNTTIADYEIGMRVQVPFGQRTLIGVIDKIFENSLQLHGLELSQLKQISRILDKINIIPRELLDLISFSVKYYHYYIGEVYAACLPKNLRDVSKVTDFTNKIIYLNSDSTFLIKNKKLSSQQQRLLEILSEHNNSISLFSLYHLGIKDTTIKSLQKNNWILLKDISNNKSINSDKNKNLLLEPPLILNQEQQQVVEIIIASLQQYKSFLLYGITGSGKTEVYLHAIHEVLKKNQQVLVLVPEISLTPQTISRFKHRFSSKIAVIHSKIAMNTKTQDWMAAKDGSAKIIIGTRSSIFTPVKNLGLIIIDEEHDTSFKQQEGFRYNGRDLAVIRAKRLNIPVVLGSATPSIESVANVIHNRYELLKLTKRAGKATLPKIKLLNIKHKYLSSGISEELLIQIKDRLKNNEQVLLFLNRRGYAPVLKCNDCSWGGLCQRCNVYYTLHKQDDILVCHYCMGSKKLPKNCPDCGSIDITSIGFGTEQIEEFITNKFKKYECIRIDRDTTKKKDDLKKHLDKIHENKPLILLGTQMLAKGHHFPNVTLVAILDVDSSLFSTDFRAPERIIQLLLQVSGRAGRSDDTSKQSTVIIQTTQPEHRILQDLLHRDYWAIATDLYEVRRLAGQPPYTAWVLLRAESYDLNNTMKFLNNIKQLGDKILVDQSILKDQLRIMGPILAPRVKKAGLLRGQLLISSSNRVNLHKFIEKLLDKINDLEIRNVRWSLDVDPQDIY